MQPTWKIPMAVMLAAAALAAAASAQSNVPAAPAPKTWVDTLSFKGDLRYRFETIDDASKKDADGDEYTRYRNRIRARLGADAKIDEKLKAGLELSTGGADPVSGNQTLGGGFDKEEFRLNLAYADYSFFGENPNELHAIIGKMKTPFLTTPDDLVLDADTNPEGLAAKGQYTVGMATLYANGGYFWAEERADTSDLMLYAGQAAAKLQFVPEAAVTFGATCYGFQNMAGFDVVDWEKKNNAYGNSTQDGTVTGTTTGPQSATSHRMARLKESWGSLQRMFFSARSPVTTSATISAITSRTPRPIALQGSPDGSHQPSPWKSTQANPVDGSGSWSRTACLRPVHGLPPS